MEKVANDKNKPDQQARVDLPDCIIYDLEPILLFVIEHPLHGWISPLVKCAHLRDFKPIGV